jgi:hypothetical protein
MKKGGNSTSKIKLVMVGNIFIKFWHGLKRIDLEVNL